MLQQISDSGYFITTKKSIWKLVFVLAFVWFVLSVIFPKLFNFEFAPFWHINTHTCTHTSPQSTSVPVWAHFNAVCCLYFSGETQRCFSETAQNYRVLVLTQTGLQRFNVMFLIASTVCYWFKLKSIRAFTSGHDSHILCAMENDSSVLLCHTLTSHQ